MENDPSTADSRARLATRLVTLAIVMMCVFGAVIIIGAAIQQYNDAKGDALVKGGQLIFSSVLPLLGTWVGTVLAFYYSKENFQAATQGTLDLVKSVGQRLDTTKAGEKMMPRASIIGVSLPAGGMDDLPLATIQKEFDERRPGGFTISRLFLFDPKGERAEGILHRATWHEMLLQGLLSTPPVDPKTETLKALLDKQNPLGKTYRDLIRNTLAFAGRDRSVAEAKMTMEATPGCQDVAVTQNGAAMEPMQGWLSNVDIGRLSQP
jgi:hypothetical protein